MNNQRTPAQIAVIDQAEAELSRLLRERLARIRAEKRTYTGKFPVLTLVDAVEEGTGRNIYEPAAVQRLHSFTCKCAACVAEMVPS